MTHYTLTPNPTPVRVADFRRAITQAEQVETDYSACTPAEREHWAHSARSAASKLMRLTCTRASLADWDRRERVIDGLATLLCKGVA